MRRLWTLVVLCAMAMAAGACGSDDSGGSGGSGAGGGSAGSAGNGSGPVGVFFGSCAKNDGSLCVDNYCAASDTAYQADRKDKCNDEETWATTKCKDGAPANCQMIFTAMGATYTVVKHHYEDTIEGIKAGCEMAGGTVF